MSTEGLERSIADLLLPVDLRVGRELRVDNPGTAREFKDLSLKGSIKRSYQDAPKTLHLRHNSRQQGRRDHSPNEYYLETRAGPFRVLGGELADEWRQGLDCWCWGVCMLAESDIS